MENTKTISQLNKKPWFRLLRVVFIIGFLIILGIFNFVTFSKGVKEIDQAKTMVYCAPKPTSDPNKFAQDFYNQRKDSFTAEEADLFLSENNFKNKQIDMVNITSVRVFTKILRECLPPNISTQALSIDQYQNHFGSIVTGIKITPVFTYNNFLMLFFIGNIGILFIFEIIKRVFYYVYLGKIKPEK